MADESDPEGEIFRWSEKLEVDCEYDEHGTPIFKHFGYPIGYTTPDQDRIVHQLEKLCRLAAQEKLKSPDELGEEIIQSHLQPLPQGLREEARQNLLEHFDVGLECAKNHLAWEEEEREAIHSKSERRLVIAMARYAIATLSNPSMTKFRDHEIYQAMPARLQRQVRSRFIAAATNSARRGKK